MAIRTAFVLLLAAAALAAPAAPAAWADEDASGTDDPAATTSEPVDTSGDDPGDGTFDATAQPVDEDSTTAPDDDPDSAGTLDDGQPTVGTIEPSTSGTEPTVAPVTDEPDAIDDGTQTLELAARDEATIGRASGPLLTLDRPSAPARGVAHARSTVTPTHLSVQHAHTTRVTLLECHQSPPDVQWEAAPDSDFTKV